VNQPVRVLIADDRPIFRAGVRGMLKDFPEIAIVGEATNGREAVEGCRRLHPDVVLMDLQMPEMGGIAATRQIKTEDPRPTILALTVSESEEDVVDMVAAGAAGYVLKDVDPVTLARSILDARAGRFQLDEGLMRRVILRLGDAMRHRPEAVAPIEPLTQKEKEILKLIVKGKSNGGIGRDLGVSEGTVKTHIRNIYRKLHVDSRPAAAARAVTLDL
jgi:DNA-binding NarL/FixJ family response regulator